MTTTDISAHYAPAGDWEHPGGDAWVLIATTDPDAPDAVTATVTATRIIYEPAAAAPPPLDLQGAAAYYQLQLRTRAAGAARTPSHRDAR